MGSIEGRTLPIDDPEPDEKRIVSLREHTEPIIIVIRVLIQAQVNLERETGIEPVTFSLARRCSTTEPLPQHCASTRQRMQYL